MSEEEQINQEKNKNHKEDFSKEKSFLKVLFISASIIILNVIGANYYIKIDRLETIAKNTQYFKKNITLKCSDAFIGNTKYHLVSNDAGWVIYDKDYFKKEELLLNIQYCKKQKIKK